MSISNKQYFKDFKIINATLLSKTGLCLSNLSSITNTQPILLKNGISYFKEDINFEKVKVELKRLYGIKKISNMQIVILVLLNSGWEGVLLEQGAYMRNILDIHIKIRRNTINSMVKKGLLMGRRRGAERISFKV